jgi:hypothetical protein
MAHLEHAYWNQQAYDTARHKIHQPRWLWLEGTLRKDGVSMAGQAIRWVTTRSGNGDAAARVLDADGRWGGRVSYDESLIDLALDGIPGANRPTQIVLHWYRPGVWMDALRICLDVGTLKFRAQALRGTGRQIYVLAYSPDYVPLSFYVHFGQLLGLSLRPHGETPAREAAVDILSPGRAQITLDMDSFLARWRDNIGQRTGPGETYPIQVGAILRPPDQAIREVVSEMADPPLVPAEYAGLVDASDGNPFLDVPSTEAETWLRVHLSTRVSL